MQRMQKYVCALVMLMLFCSTPTFAQAQPSWTILSSAEQQALESTGETIIEPQYPILPHVPLLIETAKGELGYTEQRGNITKYGQWAGVPAAEWCAEYLCWCVDQVDAQHGTALLNVVYPKYSGTNVGLRWFLRQGRYIARKGTVPDYGSQWLIGSSDAIEKNSYIPQPGDWMFFSTLVSGDTTHVAMVEYCTTGADGMVYVHVLEGNRPDRVQQGRYLLTDETILGYGTSYDLADIVLRQGHEGQKVLALQKKLQLVGLLSDQYVTGTFGPSTTEAVKQFQNMYGKVATGIANQHTQLDLDAYVSEYCLAHPELWAVSEDE